MSQDGDLQLVEGLRRNDEAAYRNFVRKYQDRIFTICLRLLNDREEAGDCAQEVFVTVFRSIDSFRGESLFSTWLYRVTVNRARNQAKYLRRRRTGLKVAWDAKPGWEPKAATGAQYPTTGRSDRPDRSSADRELAARAVDALQKIDEDFREALVLHEIEGIGYEEIAVITGVPEGTVKSRIHRARLALRNAVLEDGVIPQEEPE